MKKMMGTNNNDRGPPPSLLVSSHSPFSYPHTTLMLDPVHVVMGEIQNVLAAMRLNRRWTASMVCLFILLFVVFDHYHLNVILI